MSSPYYSYAQGHTAYFHLDRQYFLSFVEALHTKIFSLVTSLKVKKQCPCHMIDETLSGKECYVSLSSHHWTTDHTVGHLIYIPDPLPHVSHLPFSFHPISSCLFLSQFRHSPDPLLEFFFLIKPLRISSTSYTLLMPNLYFHGDHVPQCQTQICNCLWYLD